MSVLVLDKTQQGTLGARLSGLGVNVLLASGAEELTQMLSSAKSFRAVVVFRMLSWGKSMDALHELSPAVRKGLTVFVVGENEEPIELDCAVHNVREPVELETFCALVTRSLGTGR